MHMKSPSSAAPALSVSTTTEAPSALVSLPSRSGIWQRQYAPQLATRTSNAPAPSSPSHPTVISSMPGSANDFPVGNIVYQSLQRPKLLRGGEWQLSVTNNLLAAGFGILTLLTWNWHFMLGAAFFGWPVQWLIRVLGRHDPKFWQKYVRSRRQPVVREPHGRPEDSAPAPRILPRPGWFIH